MPVVISGDSHRENSMFKLISAHEGNIHNDNR